MRTILALLVALALAGVATAQTTTDPTTPPAAGDGVNDPDAFGDPADDGPSVGAPGDQQNVPAGNDPDAVGDAADDGAGTPGDQGVNNMVWIGLAIAAVLGIGLAVALSRRDRSDVHRTDVIRERRP